MGSPRAVSAQPTEPFRAEIVIGLVTRVGTNLEVIKHCLAAYLPKFGYELNTVKLSKEMHRFAVPQATPTGAHGEATTEAARTIHRNMFIGNQLRSQAKRGDVLALAAARAISASRARQTSGAAVARPGTVHLIRSLKHPAEVRALRRIYGAGFYLVGVTSSEDERRTHLQQDEGCTPEEVDDLFRVDEYEEDAGFIDPDGTNYGQRTRDTFHLADVFLPLRGTDDVHRFIDLVFSHPYTTPTEEEHNMFLAFGAGLRSGDLSRQVGAVLVDPHGDVIGTGANDVACPGGGQYWPGKGDERDHKWGEDSNHVERDRIIRDALERLRPEEIPLEDWIQSGTSRLATARLMDVTEYGRPVHAEMAALLACARVGVSPRGGTLYCTTFPCHNCAKHLVGAGVSRVVYVEPYPKSQALDLFKHEIVLGGPVYDPKSKALSKVGFQQFVGVGPRRFFDLFSISRGSGEPLQRKSGSKAIDWEPARNGRVRVPMLANTYLEREDIAQLELQKVTVDPAQPVECVPPEQVQEPDKHSTSEQERDGA
jgi:deoxycytidylate deaminase